MIHVLLAEDMVILREALVQVLSLNADITVVAECARGEDVVAQALETRPDVAILDVRLPGISGFEAAERLAEALPGCRTVFVTSYATPANLRRAVASGALGFVAKDASPDRLADAVRRVHAGERVLDPDVVTDALSHGASPLTSREAEILRRAADGEPPPAIARALSLAEGTVRNHLRSCTVKLAARNRADAFRIATGNGWI
ncbi:response regulator transcription factor [Nocardiopsis synnemataformans]|uniref:response regulator transcription factor n=1 Tax=Nocardiopsis synnemataformans TaxID=61305 RepID=UPI003EBA8B43